MKISSKPLRFILLALSAIALVAGCSGNLTIAPGSSKPLDKRFIGEWRNESMRVEYATYRGSDSTFVMEVPAGKWEAKMKMQPIRTTYKADGSYVSEYRTLTDSISLRRKGTWTANGKRLILRETEPDSREYVNDYSISGKRARFSSTLDFDSDGKNDDLYQGVQRKQ
ncbi:MAG: hypothetical protein SH848_18105 [Saprospiraceae bacterium]|nr:hypothetical protein [Saprospiraceae bacterium]MDZ4705846.1 hypothetical protein [Saprospiraceae bacterium]